MKERPILFNGDMVRAILDGRKTQTRRALKIQPLSVCEKTKKTIPYNGTPEFLLKNIKCPFGEPGDRLWVRETWCSQNPSYLKTYKEEPWRGTPCRENAEIYYQATESYPESLKWKPSIHMPRWASRINLEVKSRRVERLQEISNEDAVKESFESVSAHGFHSALVWSARQVFGKAWVNIYGEESFNQNPWVWVIEFERLP